jgi:hypothetical protein
MVADKNSLLSNKPSMDQGGNLANSYYIMDTLSLAQLTCDFLYFNLKHPPTSSLLKVKPSQHNNCSSIGNVGKTVNEQAECS